MKVLFLTPYPLGCAASQRFRFEQYFGFLAAREVEYDVSSISDEDPTLNLKS
jgi:hypothetical protein